MNEVMTRLLRCGRHFHANTGRFHLPIMKGEDAGAGDVLSPADRLDATRCTGTECLHRTLQSHLSDRCLSLRVVGAGAGDQCRVVSQLQQRTAACGAGRIAASDLSCSNYRQKFSFRSVALTGGAYTPTLLTSISEANNSAANCLLSPNSAKNTARKIGQSAIESPLSN